MKARRELADCWMMIGFWGIVASGVIFAALPIFI